MLSNMLTYMMLCMELVVLWIFSLRHIILIVGSLSHRIFSFQRIVLAACGWTGCFLLLHPGSTGLGYKLSSTCISTSGVTRNVAAVSLALTSHQIYQIWLSVCFEIVYIALNLGSWQLVPPLWRGGLGYTIRGS